MQTLGVVVMRNLLKMLTSRNQKGLWREGGPALPPSSHEMRNEVVISVERESTSREKERKTGKKDKIVSP
jgi:hypothetical protein